MSFDNFFPIRDKKKQNLPNKMISEYMYVAVSNMCCLYKIEYDNLPPSIDVAVQFDIFICFSSLTTKAVNFGPSIMQDALIRVLSNSQPYLVKIRGVFSAPF